MRFRIDIKLKYAPNLRSLLHKDCKLNALPVFNKGHILYERRDQVRD